MALTFGGLSTDRVNHGSATNIDNLTTQTGMVWIKANTITANRTMVSKANGASNIGWRLRLSGSSGDVGILWLGATAMEYSTNDTPVSTGTFKFISWTIDQAANPNAHVYTGSLTTTAVESTYGVTTQGVTFGSDATRSLFIGNQDNATPNVVFQGDIGFFALYNRVMTLSEIIGHQFRPFKASGCVLFTFPGYTGTGTQPDFSGNGNSGTVTGATFITGVPVGMPFEY